MTPKVTQLMSQAHMPGSELTNLAQDSQENYSGLVRSFS